MEHHHHGDSHHGLHSYAPCQCFGGVPGVGTTPTHSGVKGPSNTVSREHWMGGQCLVHLPVLLHCHICELIKVAIVCELEPLGGVVFTIVSCKVWGQLVSVGVVIEPGRTVIMFVFASGTGTGTGS